jgi:hypothetical protein
VSRKLDEDQVREILQLLDMGWDQAQVAPLYDVTPECLSMIWHGKRWAMVSLAMGRALPPRPYRTAERDRRSIVALAMDGWPYRVLAEMAGVAPGTIGAWVYRSRRRRRS